MAKFKEYLEASYPALWVQTHEEDRAVRVLSQEAEGYNIYSWDIVRGLYDHQNKTVQEMSDPVAPLKSIGSIPEKSILFMLDYQHFMKNIEVYRTFKSKVPLLKATSRHIVFISPVVNIPVEVEKDIRLYDFALPTREELIGIANKLVTENQLGVEVDENAVGAGIGMIMQEAEDSMALSLVSKKKFDREVIEEEKLQAVRKSGLMELYKPVDISELGGYEKIKTYLENRKRGFFDPALLKAAIRAILLVGPPGTGKSLTAKVVAGVLGFPLLRLDISKMKGSLVGQSEERMRSATALIDAIGNSVVWCDEIEKAIGGAASSNKTDGGTTSAMFGHLLTWMAESKVPKLIVATCNDVGEILELSQGALMRRFDDIFFVGFPNLEERVEILQIMNRRYDTKYPDDLCKFMENWTGAEIEKFVKSAIYDGEQEAMKNIKQVYYQNREVLDKAYAWAKVNARMAGKNGEGNKGGEHGGRKIQAMN